jgi:CheY-like chemotaxis protein
VLDLNAIVADLDGLLQRLTGADVSLSTHLSPAPALVKTDRGRLEQVLLNLVVNARDAMPQGGQVAIEVATANLAGALAGAPDGVEPGDYVVLTVSDTGHGMDAATQALAFEPFFGTKEAGGGTGLGLAIVASVVDELGGRVQVDTKPGQGSRFRVYLPCAASVAPAAEPTPAPVEKPCGSETVLVVDPDDRVRLLVRSALGTSGYTVLDARDGEAALQMAARHAGPIHLLLTDVVLPGITSSDLAGCLADQWPALRVLRTSGSPDGTAGGLVRPATPLLLKPFDPETLLCAVREALDEPAAERA